MNPAFIELTDDDEPVRVVSRAGGRPPLPTKGVAASVVADRRYTKDSEARRLGRELTVPSPATVPDTVPDEDDDPITVTDDLAAVVVRRTLKGMASGKVQPTLKDGLTAQQILDRRAEKAADRHFMLNLAMVMAGGGVPLPHKLLASPESDPDDVIEGDFTESHLAPAHLRQG